MATLSLFLVLAALLAVSLFGILAAEIGFGWIVYQVCAFAERRALVRNNFYATTAEIPRNELTGLLAFALYALWPLMIRATREQVKAISS